MSRTIHKYTLEITDLHVRIVGTGHPADDLDDWLHLGTTLMDGFLVWHVFARRAS